MQITFHFDPSCPWTWVTSRWLLRAAEVEDLQVRWAPFSLAHLSGKDERREGVRVVQHLVAAGDHDGVAHFYDALGDATHRRGRRPDADDVRAAAKEAGLPDAAVAAIDDEALDEAVGAATDQAMSAAGPDIGSPVLHWTDDQGQDVWIFGPLFDRAPDPPCAAELWRGVRHLAVHSMFKELKRGRSGPPDLSTT